MWEGMGVWRCLYHCLCVCVCGGGGGAPTANRDKGLRVGVQGDSVVVRDSEGGTSGVGGKRFMVLFGPTRNKAYWAKDPQTDQPHAPWPAP